MQFRCITAEFDEEGNEVHKDGEHGELDHVEVDGYSIAHDLDRRIHEKDLEGITFEIHSTDSEDVSEEDVKAPDAEQYLEKFPYVYGAIADVINERRWLGEAFTCPHCTREDFVGIVPEHQ